MKRQKPAPRRTRGPQKNPTKQIVTIRFDGPILDYYRATGAGWQTRMNDDLLRLVAARVTHPRRRAAHEPVKGDR